MMSKCCRTYLGPASDIRNASSLFPRISHIRRTSVLTSFSANVNPVTPSASASHSSQSRCHHRHAACLGLKQDHSKRLKVSIRSGDTRQAENTSFVQVLFHDILRYCAQKSHPHIQFPGQRFQITSQRSITDNHELRIRDSSVQFPEMPQ